MKGSLDMILRSNEVALKGEHEDTSNLLTQVGLDPNGSTKIEGYSAMRYSIVRIRVSNSYELWIQSGLQGDKDIAFKASVMPYSPKRFGVKLVDTDQWSKIEYP